MASGGQMVLQRYLVVTSAGLAGKVRINCLLCLPCIVANSFWHDADVFTEFIFDFSSGL